MCVEGESIWYCEYVRVVDNLSRWPRCSSFSCLALINHRIGRHKCYILNYPWWWWISNVLHDYAILEDAQIFISVDYNVKDLQEARGTSDFWIMYVERTPTHQKSTLLWYTWLARGCSQRTNDLHSSRDDERAVRRNAHLAFEYWDSGPRPQGNLLQSIYYCVCYSITNAFKLLLRWQSHSFSKERSLQTRKEY